MSLKGAGPGPLLLKGQLPPSESSVDDIAERLFVASVNSRGALYEYAQDPHAVRSYARYAYDVAREFVKVRADQTGEPT